MTTIIDSTVVGGSRSWDEVFNGEIGDSGCTARASKDPNSGKLSTKFFVTWYNGKDSVNILPKEEMREKLQTRIDNMNQLLDNLDLLFYEDGSVINVQDANGKPLNLLSETGNGKRSASNSKAIVHAQ